MQSNVFEKKEYIIFDFDGTISDSHDAAIETYNSISEKYGFRSVTEAEISQLKHKTSREVLKYLGISLVKLPFVMKEVRVRFQSQINDLKPIEHLGAVLAELKRRNFRLGVLTSNSGKNVQTFLENNQLGHVFDYVSGEVSIFGKTKAIKNFAKKNQIPRERMIYVGDETRDVQAAKSAGVDVIAVTWGFNTRELLEKENPTKVVESPAELLSLFEFSSPGDSE